MYLWAGGLSIRKAHIYEDKKAVCYETLIIYFDDPKGGRISHI